MLPHKEMQVHFEAGVFLKKTIKTYLYPTPTLCLLTSFVIIDSNNNHTERKLMKKSIFNKGLIDLPFKDFLQAFDSSEEDPAQIIAQESRLIPVGKKDDEMAMTTVFLSSLKYIKEFRNLISEPIGMSKSGSIYCYTEVSFPFVFSDDEKKYRFDGLVLVVSAGKIKDASIFEMKQGKNPVEKEQIERYVEMAKKLHIPRLVSVSNQFVSKATDYPIAVNLPKKCPVSLFHLSWKSIMFYAQVLLMKNDLNIEDVDQNNIMREVLRYLIDSSGTKNFDAMTVSRWKDIVIDLGSEAVKKEFKPFYEEIVKDWIQEEKDLAIKLSLILSEKEFTPVLCDKKKYQTLDERIKDEVDILQKERKLTSVYRIQNAISPMNIIVGFRSKTIRVSMAVSVPTDKKPLGKIAFIRKYVKKALAADTGITGIQKDVYITLKSKSKRMENLKYTIKEIADSESVSLPKEFDFTAAEVVIDYDIGKDLQSNSKFISILEEKVITFYTALMQYFEKWVPSSPKAEVKQPSIIQNSEEGNSDSL